MRILIVDDHALVRDGVASLVSAWGHDVVESGGSSGPGRSTTTAIFADSA